MPRPFARRFARLGGIAVHSLLLGGLMLTIPACEPRDDQTTVDVDTTDESGIPLVSRDVRGLDVMPNYWTADQSKNNQMQPSRSDLAAGIVEGAEPDDAAAPTPTPEF